MPSDGSPASAQNEMLETAIRRVFLKQIPSQRRSVMEWERLIRFGLLGDANLEPWAILLVRLALGVFFAISGGNKLFVASRTKVMYETLAAARIPFPRPMTYCVSAVEFVGGCLLVVGLLSSLAS